MPAKIALLLAGEISCGPSVVFERFGVTFVGRCRSRGWVSVIWEAIIPGRWRENFGRITRRRWQGLRRRRRRQPRVFRRPRRILVIRMTRDYRRAVSTNLCDASNWFVTEAWRLHVIHSNDIYSLLCSLRIFGTQLFVNHSKSVLATTMISIVTTGSDRWMQ
jgi:hypothetical protein